MLGRLLKSQLIPLNYLIPSDFSPRLSASLTLATLCICGQVQSQPTDEPVGEVTLVIGKAYRLPERGGRVPLSRGSRIAEGDVITTKSNGHVHIRFIDEALVSVRPNSELSIQLYEYDASNPSDSAVKFDLIEGVTRSISGEAARSARERFRLNTPIAAIGVRGTDFVVSADPDTTRALVNEGVIVLAPYSDACSSNALGPCTTNALELTDSTLQLASIQQDEILPRLLPSQSLRAPGLIQEEVKLAIVSNFEDGATNESSEVTPLYSSAARPSASNPQENIADQEVNNEVLLEGVTTVQLRADAEVAAKTVAAKDFFPIEPISVKVTAEGAVAQFDLTPPNPLTSSSLRERQLVWGRYANTPLTTDRLALSFVEAKSARDITVGNFDYGLFRSQSGPREMVKELGIVGFQLTSAQAVFNSETGVAAMVVNGGSLDIDFQTSAFDTSLDMSHPHTGSVVFTANGIIADGGFLRAFEETQRVSGAVSFDGAEAGYLFEKQMADGVIKGLTLWDSK